MLRLNFLRWPLLAFISMLLILRSLALISVWRRAPPAACFGVLERQLPMRRAFSCIVRFRRGYPI